jgi:mRNA-degrading endonuclease RelE of RelBE toxin-antitoxin system
MPSTTSSSANRSFDTDAQVRPCASRTRLPVAGQLLRYAATGRPLDSYAPKAYSLGMLTVVETLLFQKQWPLYWTEEERGEFAAFIAERPDAGDVVPGSGGIRKVRWSRTGTGKSGGVRVIYYVRTADEDVVLLTLYAKSKTDNLTGAKLKEIRRALEE